MGSHLRSYPGPLMLLRELYFDSVLIPNRGIKFITDDTVWHQLSQAFVGSPALLNTSRLDSCRNRKTMILPFCRSPPCIAFFPFCLFFLLQRDPPYQLILCTILSAGVYELHILGLNKNFPVTQDAYEFIDNNRM